MRKGSIFGYALTFLLGAGIAAVAAYMYVTTATEPHEVSPDIPKESAGPPEGEGRKSEAREIPGERPGDRSYLPSGKKGQEKTSVSARGNSIPASKGAAAADAGLAPSPARPGNEELTSKGTGKEFSLFLKQDDVNRLLDAHLSGEGANGLLPAGAVKDARLAINGKELGLHAHLNLGEIAKAATNEEERQKLEAVKKYLPFVDTSNLDVEIKGNFSVRKGMLEIDPNAQVKIASLNMRLSTLHGLLQSGAPLPTEIPIQSVQGIQIDELTVDNNGIHVTGKQAQE